MREVIWDDDADKDFSEAYSYLAKHAAPEVAHKFQLDLFRKIELIQENPLIGTKCNLKRLRATGLRMLGLSRFQEYLIFYKPQSELIRIVRVLHAKRDYRRVL